MEPWSFLMSTGAAVFCNRPSELVVSPSSVPLMMKVRIFNLNLAVTEIWIRAGKPVIRWRLDLIRIWSNMETCSLQGEFEIFFHCLEKHSGRKKLHQWSPVGMQKGTRSLVVGLSTMTKIHNALHMSFWKRPFTHVKTFSDYNLKLCNRFLKRARSSRLVKVILRRMKSTSTSMKF